MPPIKCLQGGVSAPPGQVEAMRHLPKPICSSISEGPNRLPLIAPRLFTAIVGVPRLIRAAANRNVPGTRQKLASRSQGQRCRSRSFSGIGHLCFYRSAAIWAVSDFRLVAWVAFFAFQMPGVCIVLTRISAP